MHMTQSAAPNCLTCWYIPQGQALCVCLLTCSKSWARLHKHQSSASRYLLEENLLLMYVLCMAVMLQCGRTGSWKTKEEMPARMPNLAYLSPMADWSTGTPRMTVEIHERPSQSTTTRPGSAAKSRRHLRASHSQPPTAVLLSELRSRHHKHGRHHAQTTREAGL